MEMMSRVNEEYKNNNTRLNEAICFAVERHAGQLRKGSIRPYITHPLETMNILNSMRADINLMIAGVLHDVLEDTDTTADEIIERFGEEIASLVVGHTEDKSKSWDERKSAAIEELKTASIRMKMLVMADKVSNLRDSYADYKEIGEELWSRFKAPKEKQAWYYSGIQDALREMKELRETREVYLEMEKLQAMLFGR